MNRILGWTLLIQWRRLEKRESRIKGQFSCVPNTLPRFSTLRAPLRSPLTGALQPVR
jgi:hypothetical protein